MAPGAIYQLNVKSTQDQFLTGNPEFNFIKQVYKRHTNFAIEQKELLFDTIIDFGIPLVNIEIKRTADFLGKLYFKFTLPPLTITSGTYAGWTNSIGHVIINYIDLYIGGHLIDRHYGLFLEIWYELTVEAPVNSNVNSLIGKVDQLNLLQTNALTTNTYCVPLRYWFCSDISLALPILNLYNHKVELKLNMNNFQNCIVYDGNTPPLTVSIINPSILTEYIYIDDSEKIQYTNEQTYLITQIQSSDVENIEYQNVFKSKLDFNHACSELLFVLREQSSEANNDWFNFAQRNIVPFTPVVPLLRNAKLKLDGLDRNEYLDEYTLRTVNSNRYHTNTTNKHIYIMPFCNEPENLGPSGSLNFSLIDAAELHLNLEPNISPSNLYVFVRNWNVINIRNGLFRLGFNS